MATEGKLLILPGLAGERLRDQTAYQAMKTEHYQLRKAGLPACLGYQDGQMVQPTVPDLEEVESVEEYRADLQAYRARVRAFAKRVIRCHQCREFIKCAVHTELRRQYGYDPGR